MKGLFRMMLQTLGIILVLCFEWLYLTSNCCICILLMM